ncbi:hypothetical protein [Erwinia sp. CGal63]
MLLAEFANLMAGRADKSGTKAAVIGKMAPEFLTASAIFSEWT